MNLQGNIHTMPLPDLFQWLEVVRKTGTLVVENQDNQQKFFFNNGEVVTATSTNFHITDTEAGVRMVVKDALRWEAGHFIFEDDVLPGEIGGTNLHLSPLQLVLDTLREFDETAADQSPDQPRGGHGMGEDFHYAYGLRMAVVGQLLKGDFKVPLLPTVVNKVLEITERENYSLRDLNEVIVNDPLITAQLLKHANSALYSRGSHIDSVASAIQHLGVQTVTNLVLTLSLQSAVTGRDIFLEDRKQIWLHSLGCALFARAIAPLVNLEKEQAFLCGLMIDFGKFVVISLVHELMQKNPEYHATPRHIINEVIETYHPKVGGIVGAKWKLPLAVLDAITYHHTLLKNSENARYVAAANLCDQVLLEAKQNGEADEKENADELAMRWLGDPAAEQLNLNLDQLKKIHALVATCQQGALQIANG